MEVYDYFDSEVYSYLSDTVEGPRAPAVKLTARQPSYPLRSSVDTAADGRSGRFRRSVVVLTELVWWGVFRARAPGS